MSSITNSPTPRNIKLMPCLVYGSATAMVLFYCLRSGWISSPLLDRYVLGHPVSYVETMMLFVGLLALAFKSVAILQERQAMKRWQDPQIDELPFLRADLDKDDSALASAKTQEDMLPADDPEADYQRAGTLLEVLGLRQQLKQSSTPAHGSMARRITAALQYIYNRKSAEGIQDHLKHLESQEADAQHDSYSLIRLMVWAIPMLGFLGTVLGISEALGGLDLGADADLSALIGNLKSSLYVAFDTTALALTYGVILMFFQFGLERVESRLIQDVDQHTEAFILSSFATAENQRDPVARSIQRMGQALLKATFSLVEHQHDLWNESLTAAQDAWVCATENSRQQADHVLHTVVDGASERLVDRLANAMQNADQQLEHRWQQWQVTLSDNARAISNFQRNATSHIEMLEQFFKNASDLSSDQQQSVKNLIGRLDDLIVQSRSLQLQQEKQLEVQQQREVEQIERQKQEDELRRADYQSLRERRRLDEELAENFIGPLTPAVFQEQRRRREQQGLEEGWIAAEAEPARKNNGAVDDNVRAVAQQQGQSAITLVAEELVELTEKPKPAPESMEPEPADSSTERSLAEGAKSASGLPEFRIQPALGYEWTSWNPFQPSSDSPTSPSSPAMGPSPTPASTPSPTVEATAKAEKSITVPAIRFPKPAEQQSQESTLPSSRTHRSSLSNLRLHQAAPEFGDDGQPLVTLELENEGPPMDVSAPEKQPPVNPNIRSILMPFSDAKVRRAS